MMLEIDAIGMHGKGAEDMSKVFVTTELGGGGSSKARSNAITEHEGPIEIHADLEQLTVS
jgi:N2-acetyl-L-2,4-diaminobutanoate deacetylase